MRKGPPLKGKSREKTPLLCKRYGSSPSGIVFAPLE